MEPTERQRRKAAKIWMYSTIAEMDCCTDDDYCLQVRVTAIELAHAELKKMGQIVVYSETAAMIAATKK